MKQKFVEKSPEGWEGTVKSMKDKSDVDNPWALAHWMKQKGYNSHKEAVAEDRDYKAEYKKFQSSDKAKKYRAELNQYNRKKGTYGNGDGKDASHKGGKIVGFEKESTNRGRAEKSRLKKESDFPTTTKKDKTVTVVHKTSGKELVIIDTPSTRKKYKRRDYFVQADPRKIKKAVRIAKKMSGDMTDAVKKIERIEKDLSNNHEVAYALKTANESINEINIPKFVKSTVRGRHKITKKGKGYVVQVHNPFDANKLVKFGNNKGLKIKAQHRFGASEAEYFISEGKLSESLPTKIKDLRKIKKVKTEPDSAKGTYNSTATFSQHHAGSMGAGDMGTISEPDTYDWDDSGSEPNQGGHQVKKDKKKKGYEPVREGKLTEASVWFNPKVLEPYLKKIGLKFPKYPKQGDVTKDGKKVGYMDNFNGFSVYSKSLLKQLQNVEKKYKLGIWNATSGLTMEGKLNEARLGSGKEKVYVLNGMLWISYSPNSGQTTRIRGRGWITDKSDSKNFDSGVRLYVKWAKQNKPIKKSKTQKLFKIPEFDGGDAKEYTIWGGDEKPKKWVYLLVATGKKINVITVFHSRGEAMSWIGHTYHTDESVNEDSLGDKFGKTIQKYQDRVKKEKEAYKKARERQKAKKEGKLKEAKENPIDVARRVVKNSQAEKVGGVLVDMQTANLIVQIYDKVNSSNKKKMEKTPMKKLGALVWRVAKKARR